MQFVLPIDSADIRALLVNPAAFEVVIEMPADTIATIQAGSFCQQMDTFAAFPALIAGKLSGPSAMGLQDRLGLY